MSDLDALLEPLRRLTLKQPTIEGIVFWHGATGWSDATGETLDAEEIPYYAEGLLMEGFGMAWDHITEPGFGDHIRLCFWQGTPPPPLPLAPGAIRVSGGQSQA